MWKQCGPVDILTLSLSFLCRHAVCLEYTFIQVQTWERSQRGTNPTKLWPQCHTPLKKINSGQEVKWLVQGLMAGPAQNHSCVSVCRSFACPLQNWFSTLCSELEATVTLEQQYANATFSSKAPRGLSSLLRACRYFLIFNLNLFFCPNYEELKGLHFWTRLGSIIIFY